MIDTSMIGLLGADAMGQMSEAFKDQDDGEIRTVLIAVESEDGEGRYIRTFSTEDRPWVVQAFVDEVADSLTVMRDRFESTDS